VTAFEIAVGIFSVFTFWVVLVHAPKPPTIRASLAFNASILGCIWFAVRLVQVVLS
jgi:hypothetical protein